jgi:hypothetical protein
MSPLLGLDSFDDDDDDDDDVECSQNSTDLREGREEVDLRHRAG